MQKEAPIACSLDAGELERRRGEIEALARAALVGRERGSGKVRLRYRRSDEVEAAVRDLVRRERQCCPFLDFDLTVGDQELILDIAGPPEADAVLDALSEE